MEGRSTSETAGTTTQMNEQHDRMNGQQKRNETILEVRKPCYTAGIAKLPLNN